MWNKCKFSIAKCVCWASIPHFQRYQPARQKGHSTRSAQFCCACQRLPRSIYPKQPSNPKSSSARHEEYFISDRNTCWQSSQPHLLPLPSTHPRLSNSYVLLSCAAVHWLFSCLVSQGLVKTELDEWFKPWILLVRAPRTLSICSQDPTPHNKNEYFTRDTYVNQKSSKVFNFLLAPLHFSIFTFLCTRFYRHLMRSVFA